MKRFLLGIGIVLATIGIVGAVSGTANAKSVNDFNINDFDVEYHLSRDQSGRSVLKTVEKITATFPEFDQNHGIERAIPTSYDGHSTHIAINSVTDEVGTRLSYNDDNSTSDNVVLRVGDVDTYVHGVKTYVITYTQHDVTKFFADTNDDELYWDVNGTQWAQRIERLRARVFVDPSLASTLSNTASCYQGVQGSAEKCDAVRGIDSNAATFVFSSTRPLLAGENVSFAIGLTSHTFASYQQTWEEKLFAFAVMVWLISLVVGSIVALIIFVWMSVVRARTMNRIKGRGTIIPEYLPPKEMSALTSAFVLKLTAAAMTAQLIDLAVRHYLKIYQTSEKSFFKAAEYEIELVKKTDDLLFEEKQLLTSLFGPDPVVGERYKMKDLQNDYVVGKKLISNRKELRDKVRGSYGLYEKATKEAKRLNRIAVCMLIAGILTLSPAVVGVAIIGFVYAYTLWPLTEKGVNLRDYLAGLKLYISVAEVERIKMLQSPDGAEKVGVIDDDNPKQFIKLYERVLPYAVLFGQEKEWVKQLGAYYESGATQPDWYVGNGAFNAVMFSSALSSFSEQSTSYSSSSSSSSGGSDGGGFSGGGGGGGGGGGW